MAPMKPGETPLPPHSMVAGYSLRGRGLDLTQGENLGRANQAGDFESPRRGVDLRLAVVLDDE